MPAPDFGPMTLRRLAVIQERQELIYASIYLAVFLSFIAVLIALYIVRRDLLKAYQSLA